MTLPTIRGVVSDLDGVVFRGAEPIASAVLAFAVFAARGIPYGFVTNNSTRTPREVAEKLTAMGVAATADQVVTSASAAAAILRERWPQGGRAFVVGAPALLEAVGEVGFEPAEAHADCVVVGLDRHFTYERLSRAARFVREGAVLVGTNPDPILPVPGGFDPGAGSILAAVATAGGVEPIVAGKPHRSIVDEAVRRLGLPRGDLVMIGDQAATDIMAGQAAGLFSILVRTGVPPRADPAIVPDLVLDDLSELVR